MGHLEGLHRTDAVIVGGSLAGLLTAAALAGNGMKVAVIDAGNAEAAVDYQTATTLYGWDYSRILAAHGTSAAKQYAAGLQTQLHALLDSPPLYVRSTPVFAYVRNKSELPELERHQALYAQLHVPVSIASDAGGCPFPVELSLTSPGAAVNITAWKTALRTSILRQSGRIYTESRVIALDGKRVCTSQGCVDAPHVVLATGKPLGLLDKRLLALLETRLTVHCALTSPYPLHSCQQEITEGGLSLTPTPTGMLASMDAGRCGLRTSAQVAAFERLLHHRLPDWQRGELVFSQCIRATDGLPVIGVLPHSGLLCASGCTSILGAMHAAELLTRRICRHMQPEDALYAPDRHIPHWIIRREMRRNAVIYARNMLRRSAPDCSHCGCRMRYDTARQHWECPFCGTDYTMLGQVVSGPGMRPASVSVRQRPDI